jgi:hypothetical protein
MPHSPSHPHSLPRLTAAAVSATAVVASAVAITGAPATAADIEFTLTIDKSLVVQYADDCSPADVSWGADGTGVAKVVLTWTLPDGSVEYRETAAPGETRGLGTGCPAADELGKSTLRVTAYDSSGRALGHKDASFYQKFNTTISGFNAAPEPVHRGKAIIVSGRLLRLAYSPKVGYYSYGGRTIKVYFQLRGHTTWSYVGGATTGSDGRFKKSFTASHDGRWRVRYAGNSSYDKQTSPSDYVNVV